MRDGVYSHPLGAHAAALTNDEAALEALVAASLEAEAAAGEGRGALHGAPCAQGEGPSFTGALQDLAAHLEAGVCMGPGPRGAVGHEEEYGEEGEEGAFGYDDDDGGEGGYAPEAGAEAEAASGGSGATGVRRLEEIEAEVEAMLAATTAAAERIAANGGGGEEGAYLSEVLGRAQAAVDAMAETFPGWETRFGADAAGQAADAAAEAADIEEEAEPLAAAAAAAPESAHKSHFTAGPGEGPAAAFAVPSPVGFDFSWDEDEPGSGAAAAAAVAVAGSEPLLGEDGWEGQQQQRQQPGSTGEPGLAEQGSALIAEDPLTAADGDTSSIWGGPVTGPGMAAADADAEWDAEELAAEDSAPLIEL
jgi:hypothetical protein